MADQEIDTRPTDDKTVPGNMEIDNVPDSKHADNASEETVPKEYELKNPNTNPEDKMVAEGNVEESVTRSEGTAVAAAVPLGANDNATEVQVPAFKANVNPNTGFEFTSGLDVFHKGPLLEKVHCLLRGNEGMKKRWCGFCEVHGAQVWRPEMQDEAFLMTFLHALEENGAPEYQGALPMELQEGKGFHFHQQKGAMPQGGAKGWGDQWNTAGKDVGKIFVGGLPRHATEQSLGELFSYFGQVSKVQLKYQDDGSAKGFAFVTFVDPSLVPQVVQASQSGQTMMGDKWLNCKEVENGPALGQVGKKGPIKGMEKGCGKIMPGKPVGWENSFGGKDVSKGWDGRPAGKGWDTSAAKGGWEGKQGHVGWGMQQQQQKGTWKSSW